MKLRPTLAIAVFLSTLVLVCVCFKKVDLLLINEVKTLVSVIFGFATSCFLLSVIWVIQEKKISSLSWPMSGNRLMNSLVIVNIATDSNQDGNAPGSGRRRHRRSTVCTILSLIDTPPSYDDALVNSKPINYVHLPPAQPQQQLAPTIPALELEDEAKFSHQLSKPNINPHSSKLSALKLQVAATSAGAPSNQQLPTHDDLHEPARKVSFCQLNAHQLMLMVPPPAYSDCVCQDLNTYITETDATNKPHNHQITTYPQRQ